jgi:hypothetical protein
VEDPAHSNNSLSGTRRRQTTQSGPSTSRKKHKARSSAQASSSRQTLEDVIMHDAGDPDSDDSDSSSSPSDPDPDNAESTHADTDESDSDKSGVSTRALCTDQKAISTALICNLG